jgi:hypothetical protein
VTDLRRVYTFSAPSPAQQALIDAVGMRCGTSGCGGEIVVDAWWKVEGMGLAGQGYLCKICMKLAKKGSARAR